MKINLNQTLDHRYDGSNRWKQPEGRDDILGMGTADMDFYCPSCVAKVTQEISDYNTYNYHYKPDSYYNSIIRWYHNYQLDVKKEWIQDLPSTLGAIRLLLGCYTSKNDYVLMQTPCFIPLVKCIEGANCQFIDNPLQLIDGHYEIDFDDLEYKFKTYHPRIFLLVSPHNPTGRLFTQEELERMVNLCSQYHVLIISDEVHCLITFDHAKFIPILKISSAAQEISIQVFSMSKGYNVMSLPHVMFLIPNETIRAQWLDYIIPFDFHYSYNLYTLATMTALMEGKGEDWLNQVTLYLEENRNILIEEFKKRNLPLIPIKPEASYLLWIDCRPTGYNFNTLSELFEERAGIHLNNGLAHGEEGKGFIRLNYAVTRDTLYQAIDRIEHMFK